MSPAPNEPFGDLGAALGNPDFGQTVVSLARSFPSARRTRYALRPPPASLPPVFDTELQTLTPGFGSTNTRVFTIPAAGVPVGKTLIILASGDGGGSGITSITDSKGNSWAIEVDATGGARSAKIFRAYITTALVSGDTVTLVYAFAFSRFCGKLLQFSNVANVAKDLTATTSGSSTSSVDFSTSSPTGYSQELVIVGVGTDNIATSATVGAGYSFAGTSYLRNAAGVACSCEYLVAAQPNGQRGRMTFDTNTSWSAGMLTLRSNVSIKSVVPDPVGIQASILARPPRRVNRSFLYPPTVVAPPGTGVTKGVVFFARLVNRRTHSFFTGPSPFTTSTARLSQEAVEVIRSETATLQALLSQEAVEVLRQVPHDINAPFISSTTQVFDPFSIYEDFVGVGAGNGGELFNLILAASGDVETATLVASITDTDTLLQLAGDGGFPSPGGVVATINAEVVYMISIGSGYYRIRGRGMSGTTAAAHTAGASVVWNDTYDMAVYSTENINSSFTADILGTGSYVYYGWAIAYDSTQAYLSGNRYPMHVSELIGIYTTSGGTNKLDASQPNAICVPAGVSDDCPASLSVPARIATNVVPGDFALLRYQNTEASRLELGARSCSLLTWYGMKRVNAADADVTLTDPTGFIVDGTVEDTWLDPLGPGINPTTGAPITNAFFTTVTLLGSDRTFTHGGTPSPPNYNEKGWPICCLAVRQGTRRVPFWQSYDWKDYSFVYAGFDPDATYAQMVVNRNGIVNASTSIINLPGPQDIDGPDALWDDNTYYFAAAWYVILWTGPYLLTGPPIGGGVSPGGGTSNPTISVVFDGGGSPTFDIPPDPVEGGSGGNIDPPSAVAGPKFRASLM